MNRRIFASVMVPVVWMLAAIPAAALEIGGIRVDDSDQRVAVSLKRGSWHQTVDGTTQVVPMMTIHFALGNFNYALRHDGGGPYPNGIGISYPTASNWYQSDAINLLINGKKYPTGHGAGEQLAVTEAGPRGDAVFQWENETARISYDFCGLYMDRNLYLLITLEPKVEVTALTLQLNGFPGGNLRGGKQHPLQVYSNAGSRELPAGKTGDLAPESTDRVLLYRSEELASQGFRGGCGVVFSGPEIKAVRVTNQFYSQVILELAPETRLIRIALSEWTIPAPAEPFARQAELAAKRLPELQPIPFAAPKEP